jgi:hypothetical protein
VVPIGFSSVGLLLSAGVCSLFNDELDIISTDFPQLEMSGMKKNKNIKTIF